MAGRFFAGLIAAVAWFGLVVQWVALCTPETSAFAALGIMFGYFTITTNLLVAVVFSSAALEWGGLRAAWVVAGTTLSILLVGVIYGLLLHGLLELAGGGAVANVVLHMVTPVLVLLYWIFFTEKGSLSWRCPLLWAIYPLAYLGYALARGGVTGRYPYPFMNVMVLGWARTGVNAAGIAVAFLVASYGLVWVDGRLGRRGEDGYLSG